MNFSAGVNGVKCGHCGGAIETVKPRSLPEFQRCKSCGRDDRATATGISGSQYDSYEKKLTAPSPSPSVKCNVDGCPGFHAPGRSCVCCQKREEWVQLNRPARFCAICGGAIDKRGGKKHCGACKVEVKRIAVVKAKAKATS